MNYDISRINASKLIRLKELRVLTLDETDLFYDTMRLIELHNIIEEFDDKYDIKYKKQDLPRKIIYAEIKSRVEGSKKIKKVLNKICEHLKKY